MAPTRIMFIRHAEKPGHGVASGVDSNGMADPKSLTPRGWQRAGALVRYFSPLRETEPVATIKPSTIFAAGIDMGDPSRRPIETVTPLFEFLKSQGPIELITQHLKADHQALVDDVLSREGVVLVAWEHREIPALISLLPNRPKTPESWPGDRFDVTWLFDNTPDGWTFSQMPQLLLAGDTTEPIL
ncbi:phosphoglycerate mutase family protein [Paraburkholderia sp. IMGN_8]|uniref:phosphoglycerate mutase family protein n=1 Tax=Paraburkholderia sp. IMGN_8 TaxID=3136564 RepID=UPI0031012960